MVGFIPLSLLATVSVTLFCMTSCQSSCTWRDAANPVPSVNCGGAVLNVTYNGHAVVCDEDLSTHDLQTRPRLHWSSADPTQTYMLLMLDTDAPRPCQPDLSYIIHWAAFVQGQNLQVTHEFIPYRAPHPPTTSPAHRYQFLLYDWQPGPGLDNPDFLGHFSNNRIHFDLQRFKRINDLGTEVAVFQIQFGN